MELMEVAACLSGILDRPRPLYLRSEPEVPDFTNHSPCKVVISGGQRHVEIDIDRKNAIAVLGILKYTVFNPEKVPTLLCWNLKSLLSYFRFYSDKPLNFTSPILDLQVIEGFLGINGNVPETIIEATARSKEIAKNKSWKEVYKKIHTPLIFNVLPEIETFPLLNTKERTPLYAHYEIEGQKNGRLRCCGKFKKSLLAHNLGKDQKSLLKPRGYNLNFITADFRHCEINVIQWLSKDDRLGDIIHSGEDLYKSIYRVITEDECNSEKKRAMAKIMLLAVFYGSGYKGLANNLKITDSASKELIKRIHYRFPGACEWFNRKQEEAAGGEQISDFFGRPRTFSESTHAVRNFLIQGVAATFCLEKLIQLHRKLEHTPAKICLTIHDGYGVVAPSNRCHEIASLVREVLESESELCPNLRMKTEVKVGNQLDDMTVV